ncbi:MAG: hypothetical protein IPO26_18065 [Saprospiraceae bacterium]|nr:hypothetical protein [Saprospiraceae bacterium]
MRYTSGTVCVASTGYNNNMIKWKPIICKIQVSNVKGYSIPHIAHVFLHCCVSIRRNPVLPTFGIGGTPLQKNKDQMRYDKEQIDQWQTEWEQSGQSISKYCDGKPFD